MSVASQKTIRTVKELVLDNEVLNDAEKLQITIMAEQAEIQRNISEHLWWLALVAKLTLIMVIFQFAFILSLNR